MISLTELHTLLAVAGMEPSPAYGIAIADRLARCGAPGRKGTVYPILERLKERGLLSMHMLPAMPYRGGRARACYQLTKKGQRTMINNSISYCGCAMKSLSEGATKPREGKSVPAPRGGQWKPTQVTPCGNKSQNSATSLAVTP